MEPIEQSLGNSVQRLRIGSGEADHVILLSPEHGQPDHVLQERVAEVILEIRMPGELGIISQSSLLHGAFDPVAVLIDRTPC